MRRGFWSALFCLVILIGCLSASAAQVELTIWAWPAGTTNGDILARYIAMYEEQNPHVTIKVEKQGNQEKQLLVAFAADAAPDIVQGVGTWANTLGPMGVLLPLDSFIDGPNGFPRDDFIDDLWSFCSVDGVTYQLAADSNERALFVDADAAESTGIALSQPIRDWNDLLQWARKLTYRVGDKVERWGFDMHQENTGSRWHWIWLNEGEIFSKDKTQSVLDHPNTIEAIKFAADMVNSYHVSPRPGEVTGGSKQNFMNGKYGMMITASSFVKTLQERNANFITVPGPPGPGKGGYRFSGASNSVMGVLSSSKHPEEAWAFLRWLMYEQGVEFARELGGIPYLKNALRDPKYTRQPYNAFAVSITTYQPRNNYMAGVSTSDWMPQFDAAWAAALRQEQAPEVAIQQAMDVINARMAELRK
ncbi:MAG TPA: extracellular solute-binding protein [Firmicutes bacterium]|jgi:ABC-type glycerol-3-phosphate transport system substrate-binding protein|nr:extracellular solute-binding protein [Bacillota bacterium]